MVRLPRYFVEGQPQHLIQHGNNRELPSRLKSKIATRFSTVGVERGLPDLHGQKEEFPGSGLTFDMFDMGLLQLLYSPANRCIANAEMIAYLR